MYVYNRLLTYSVKLVIYLDLQLFIANFNVL